MVWRPSVAMSGWLIAGVVLSVLGLLARRAEITALGVPFLVGVAWSISRRPRRGARVEVVAADQPVSAGGMSARVVLDPDPAAGVIALRIAAPGHRRVEALVAAELRAVSLTMTSVRTGRRDLFRVDHRESGPDLLLETSATITASPDPTCCWRPPRRANRRPAPPCSPGPGRWGSCRCRCDCRA